MKRPHSSCAVPTEQPSLRLDLAAATAQWALSHGAVMHEHVRLEEREGRGVCLVAVDAIAAGATLIRVPRSLCVTSDDARRDPDVARVLGEEAHEAFGALLLLTLKLLATADKGPFFQYLECIADETLLKPPACGGGPLRDALWKGVHAQDQAFAEAFAPRLKDTFFGGVTATAYALARKLIETRAFQLETGALTRRDSVQALVPLMDLVNYARDCHTTLLITDDSIELRATAVLEGEVCWDYSGPEKAPLDILTQYGFLPLDEDVPGVGHVVPLRSEALGQLLDGAAFAPLLEGAQDTVLRRRRAVALRFCVDLEQTPILAQRREAPSAIVFWVDVEDPLASPLALALRVALADAGEINARDRTVKAWVQPIAAEATVRRALHDCAVAVRAEVLSYPDGPVVTYQCDQLTRLAAGLAA